MDVFFHQRVNKCNTHFQFHFYLSSYTENHSVVNIVIGCGNGTNETFTVFKNGFKSLIFEKIHSSIEIGSKYEFLPNFLNSNISLFLRFIFSAKIQIRGLVYPCHAIIVNWDIFKVIFGIRPPHAGGVHPRFFGQSIKNILQLIDILVVEMYSSAFATPLWPLSAKNPLFTQLLRSLSI